MTRGTVFPVIVLQFIGANGPFDLTGYTAQAEVRAEPGGDVIVDLEPTVIDATGGYVALAEFNDEETMLYPAGVYQWDFLLTDANGNTFGRFLMGQFYIVDKITDS